MEDIAENIEGLAPGGGSYFWSVDTSDGKIRKHSLSNPSTIQSSLSADDYGGLAWGGSSFWGISRSHLYRVSSSGTELNQYQPACTSPDLPSNSFEDLYYKDGFIWILRDNSPDSSLMKVNPSSGTCVAGWVLPGIAYAGGLTWDPDRNVWWVLQPGSRTLWQLDGANPSTVQDSYTVSNLDDAHRSLLYQDGSLYAAGGNHDGSDAIVRITPPPIPVYTPPSAGLTADPSTSPAPADVTFSLTATQGSNPITSWTLTYGDGATDTGSGNPNTATRTHRYQEPGSYTASFTVSDGEEQRSASVEVSVTTPDDAGNDKASAKQLTIGQAYQTQVGGSDAKDFFKILLDQGDRVRVWIKPIESIDLDWTVHYPDGGLAQQGATGTGNEYYDLEDTESSGYYYVDVRTKNPDESARYEIFIEDTSNIQNQLPTARLDASPTTGTTPLEVRFTGTASDPDGTIEYWEIDYGDGTIDGGFSSDIDIPEHTYAEPGSYHVLLTAVDDRGGTASDDLTISVTGSHPVDGPPRLIRGGISPASHSTPSSSSFTASPQESIRAWYRIENPRQQSVTVTLGMTVVDEADQRHHDSERDESCMVQAESTTWCNRIFHLPKEIEGGAAQVQLAIWTSPTNFHEDDRYAGTTLTGRLNIRPVADTEFEEDQDQEDAQQSDSPWIAEKDHTVAGTLRREPGQGGFGIYFIHGICSSHRMWMYGEDREDGKDGSGSKLFNLLQDHVHSLRAPTYTPTAMNWPEEGTPLRINEPEKMADDLADDLQHWAMSEGLDSVWLVGHSNGGLMARLLAERDLGVRIGRVLTLDSPDDPFLRADLHLDLGPTCGRGGIEEGKIDDAWAAYTRDFLGANPLSAEPDWRSKLSREPEGTMLIRVVYDDPAACSLWTPACLAGNVAVPAWARVEEGTVHLLADSLAYLSAMPHAFNPLPDNVCNSIKGRAIIIESGPAIQKGIHHSKATTYHAGVLENLLLHGLKGPTLMDLQERGSLYFDCVSERSRASGYLGPRTTVNVATGETTVTQTNDERPVQVEVTPRSTGLTARASSDIHEGQMLPFALHDVPLDVLGYDVRLDGVLLDHASNYEDVHDPTDDGNRGEYLVVHGADGVELLVSVPHFSQRLIEVDFIREQTHSSSPAGDAPARPVPGVHFVWLLPSMAAVVLALRRKNEEEV